jgi:hypothetical protein
VGPGVRIKAIENRNICYSHRESNPNSSPVHPIARRDIELAIINYHGITEVRAAAMFLFSLKILIKARYFPILYGHFSVGEFHRPQKFGHDGYVSTVHHKKWKVQRRADNQCHDIHTEDSENCSMTLRY